MTLSKPYSSKEIAQVVERWQPCQFFVYETKEPIITISHYELYVPRSWAHCSPAALEKIKAALQQTYAQGIRDVGLLCAPYVQDQLIAAALSITTDIHWKIYPHTQLTYDKALLEVKEKIWDAAIIQAKAEASLTQFQEEYADRLGFTAEVLDELAQYEHVKEAKDLPEHLRKLFADGQTEENE
jgi:hypothetical protein